MGEIFQRQAAVLAKGVLISVTEVRMSPDLGYARIYLSVFPFDRHAEVMRVVEENTRPLRKMLGDRLKNQLKLIPELTFALDDSLEYVENIDTLLQE